MVRVLRLGVCAAVALALSGCQSVDDSTPETTADSREVEIESARWFFDQVAACMSERGVPAEVIADGEGIEYASPPGTEHGTEVIYDQCAEEQGGEPTAAPLRDEEISKVYEQFLGVRECLIENGHAASDPPTEETFIGQYKAVGHDQSVSLWTPYPEQGGIVDVGALEACPTANVFDG